MSSLSELSVSSLSELSVSSLSKLSVSPLSSTHKYQHNQTSTVKTVSLKVRTYIMFHCILYYVHLHDYNMFNYIKGTHIFSSLADILSSFQSRCREVCEVALLPTFNKVVWEEVSKCSVMCKE